jgi:hypothetical protein
MPALGSKRAQPTNEALAEPFRAHRIASIAIATNRQRAAAIAAVTKRNVAMSPMTRLRVVVHATWARAGHLQAPTSPHPPRTLATSPNGRGEDARTGASD